MNTRRPDVSLEQVLAALERELIDASDEEVLAAAAELGMNPSMKGSAAFLGVKSPLIRAAASTSRGGPHRPAGESAFPGRRRL